MARQHKLMASLEPPRTGSRHKAAPPRLSPQQREERLAVEGEAVVGAHTAPLAVRTQALQRFRDFTVVFARIENTYEVRMLELGRRSPEWTEVLGGLEPGEVYVSENAYLIRADIEKSGASHDH